MLVMYLDGGAQIEPEGNKSVAEETPKEDVALQKTTLVKRWPMGMVVKPMALVFFPLWIFVTL